MTFTDLLVTVALVASVSFLAYEVGEMRGKAEGRMVGYQMCRGEDDSDRPYTARREKHGSHGM